MGRGCDSGRKADLLVIDDQSVMRALIRDFLQTSIPNLVIAEAPDGKRGMQLVAERNPRVVLMDVNLPDANGIELTAKIKNLHPHIQVIMVSNLGGSAYVERAHIAGALGYVHKDKIYTDLLPFLTRALGASPPHETGAQ
jgi:DNA-binding NarL/FixJ family response regulator